MPFLTITKLLGEGRLFFRRHWQRALRIREKVRFSEEAFHLVLAGAVGVMGGLVNLLFYRATESVKLLFLRSPGDPIEVAEVMLPSMIFCFPERAACLRNLALKSGAGGS